MSGFRETFTRGEKDNILGYDDSASLYFGGCVLICILVPWTYLLVKRLLWPSSLIDEVVNGNGEQIQRCSCTFCCITNVQRKKKCQSWSQRISISTVSQLSMLVLLWTCCINIAIRLSQTVTIAAFDPFEILGIETSATSRDIRKAYHTLSLKHHPDKNPNDPTSSAHFILIAKAFETLTNPTSRENYEKYGNPDGPGIMKIGIGLPHFLVAKEYQLFILLFFFALLLGVVPGIFIWYYQRQKKYAPNGLSLETIQLLGYHMKEQSRSRQLIEFLAASAESREFTKLRPTDNSEMNEVIRLVEDTDKKRMQFNHPLVIRNHFLIIAHLQRLHSILSPSLKEDLNSILERSDIITECMMEIAYVHEWALTVQAVVDFRRCLIQGLESVTLASSLLQIPHFNQSIIKHCLKGKNAVKDLKGFLCQDAKDRKGLIGMSDEQLNDIVSFCSHVPLLEITATAVVEGEDDIVEGDIVTITVKLRRTNLKAGETAGPIHAPLFPKLKHEEWWIYLTEKSSGHFVSFALCKNQSYECEERMQFRITKKGKQVYHVNAMCDSYAGIDVGTDLTFQVLSEYEVDREIVVHPEDEALDSQPTLFQQMLGTNEEHDSSDDENES